MARQKPWHRTSAWEAPNIPVRLWGPASDLSLTSGGYYAEKGDGKCISDNSYHCTEVETSSLPSPSFRTTTAAES